MTILTETRPGYRVITLNRPARLNAIDGALRRDLMAALLAAEADTDCRALLLTGAGRAFSSGQDLTEEMLPEDGAAPDLGDLLDASYHPIIRKLRALPMPIVCAVNGIAAGAGANIALACDIVLAARSASFVQAFARIGLIPDCGGTWFLSRLVGMARARALSLLAEPVAADIAADWGMIWQAVDDDRLMDEAHALAARLAGQAAAALALIKRALDAAAGNPLDRQLDVERDLQALAAQSPDYREGVRAFLEKRPAVFTGRRG
jgi:2-(1,2-epoxy-1,2-dihydrophenyl)acetyl-CoA isomerase